MSTVYFVLSSYPVCLSVSILEHLELVGKMEETKRMMEEKLSEWKRDEEEEDNTADTQEMAPPPAKLSPTKMLKKRMREEEEERTGIRITIRGSAVFSNASPVTVSKFRKECSSYESLPDAPSSVDQLVILICCVVSKCPNCMGKNHIFLSLDSILHSVKKIFSEAICGLPHHNGYQDESLLFGGPWCSTNWLFINCWGIHHN